MPRNDSKQGKINYIDLRNDDNILIKSENINIKLRKSGFG